MLVVSACGGCSGGGDAGHEPEAGPFGELGAHAVVGGLESFGQFAGGPFVSGVAEMAGANNPAVAAGDCGRNGTSGRGGQDCEGSDRPSRGPVA